MLVAMVTRVTQGHSGRPLVLGRAPALYFLAVRFVAVMRIASEFYADQTFWLALTACAPLLAFLGAAFAVDLRHAARHGAPGWVGAMIEFYRRSASCTSPA